MDRQPARDKKAVSLHTSRSGYHHLKLEGCSSLRGQPLRVAWWSSEAKVWVYRGRLLLHFRSLPLSAPSNMKGAQVINI